MKNSVGEFLSMNSFLSTSRDRSTALKFARKIQVTGDVEPIIFEIEIDPRLQTKAFADITQSSYFQNENEILIILGALFRIEKITQDNKDRLWIAQLSLASEDDFHLKETFAYMKNTIGDDTDLDSLGKILLEMGEYEQSQKCYERMQHDLQVKMGDCQMGLGKAYQWQREDTVALAHYKQALKIREESLSPTHKSFGEVYTSIGTLQWQRLKDYDKALISLRKAMTILEKANPYDPLQLSKAYGSIAATYDCMGQYSLALEYYNKCLTIQQSNLPTNHPRIALTYNNLGCLYRAISNYEEALKFYQKSLSINRKILPPTHEDIVRTEKNIHALQKAIKK
ncbi:unnamed protein product [Adineta steineri]|uniref:Tetratricopeptide repeat protein n=1 Tax=Adineta steineri TaxID=433720 RepID=A0A815FAT9_9BILA|nr:unnamed protein product [Adineta steineri]CAF1439852.1 unnamed protein product [Adineta steineri]CAF3807866.1 unnamed protein product [Adineta steineri]CAF4065291.1 unnamed protein product [Adineta steineri]